MELVAAGVEWATAAKKAGYSETTILKKSATLKRRAGEPVQGRKPNGFVVPVPRPNPANRRSPLSGKVLPHWYEQAPSSTPDRKPYTPLDHPLLGDGVVSANGGFLPAWARDLRSGGDLDLSSQAVPKSNWSLANSYQWYREPTLPAPMTYTKQEELPERGYANEGRDILQEALEGRFGLARRYEGQTE